MGLFKRITRLVKASGGHFKAAAFETVDDLRETGEEALDRAGELAEEAFSKARDLSDDAIDAADPMLEATRRASAEAWNATRKAAEGVSEKLKGKDTTDDTDQVDNA